MVHLIFQQALFLTFTRNQIVVTSSQDFLRLRLNRRWSYNSNVNWASRKIDTSEEIGNPKLNVTTSNKAAHQRSSTWKILSTLERFIEHSRPFSTTLNNHVSVSHGNLLEPTLISYFELMWATLIVLLGNWCRWIFYFMLGLTCGVRWLDDFI